MKKIKEIVVVEGKTDTALLKELFEVDTIETHGLALDQQTLELIQEASKSRGIIVLTDPDFPGKKIRDQIQAVVPNCQHAFVAKKDARGKKKLDIAEAIIGNKQRRLMVYEAFNLGYGNVKTLFKRLNMVGITKEQVLGRLNDGSR